MYKLERSFLKLGVYLKNLKTAAYVFVIKRSVCAGNSDLLRLLFVFDVPLMTG